MTAHGIAPIDLLVVNLYPFEATVAKGAAYDDCIENIDIGGPAMIRAAAKNHDDVAVVVEPDDYARVLDELTAHGGATTLALRKTLAAEGLCAHRRLRRGDLQLVRQRARRGRAGLPRVRRQARRGAALRREPAPERGVLSRARAALRRRDRAAGAGQAALLQQHQRHRRGLRMRRRVRSASARAACVIVKHANPCGVAEGASLVEAYRKALACDPTSAFGGIVALNRTLDAEAARAITEIFTEVIIAPDATEEAIAIVGAKKNLRLLLAGGLPDPRAAGLTVKSVAGGLAGAVARQRRGRRDAAEGRHQARADARPSSPTCASPSASPST